MNKRAYLPDASGIVDHEVMLGDKISWIEFFEQRVMFTDQMFQINSHSIRDDWRKHNIYYLQ